MCVVGVVQMNIEERGESNKKLREGKRRRGGGGERNICRIEKEGR